MGSLFQQQQEANSLHSEGRLDASLSHREDAPRPTPLSVPVLPGHTIFDDVMPY